MGSSKVEEDQLDTARKLLEDAGDKLLLPPDAVVAAAFDAAAERREVDSHDIPPGWMMLDVGPRTVEAFADVVASAGTVVWNGPLGVYEMEPFRAGTEAVARAVAASPAVTIIGGGDLAAAIANLGLEDAITHVSTGGGATLEFLEGKQLPGIKALEVMSRTPLVAGNWKMNKTVPESLALVEEIGAGLTRLDDIEVAILPPFTSLWPVSTSGIADTGVVLGAQDMYWEASGAFTGEISPLMLSGWCRYALIGHSERRQLFGETDETVNRKAHAALAHGLRPMVAVGETLEENEAGQTEAVLSRQVPAGLGGIDERQGLELVMAYEPIWAIGTGRTATPEHAEQSCALIRRLVAQVLGTAVADSVRILYGGSVTPANADELMSRDNVDGALVGGASLVAADFLAIIAAATPRPA